MLAPGASVPDVLVWAPPGEEAQPLRQVLGEGLTLLLFYPFDWSPT
jgi:peroxiredoxin